MPELENESLWKQNKVYFYIYLYLYICTVLFSHYFSIYNKKIYLTCVFQDCVNPQYQFSDSKTNIIFELVQVSHPLKITNMNSDLSFVGSLWPVKLRVYPRLFGKKVVHLMPQLTTQGEGKPFVGVKTTVSATAAFDSAPWSDWPEARLKEAVRYARGNTHLEAPQGWREVFPRAI